VDGVWNFHQEEVLSMVSENFHLDEVLPMMFKIFIEQKSCG
jgi:hypothetical protein